MAKRRIIIDTDPGIDDALALILAVKSPELNLEGVTIVPGNVEPTIGGENALKVLDAVDADYIPVFLGAKNPLERKIVPALHIHGADGLGDCNWPSTKRSVESKNGIDYLIEQARLYPKELTLICLGPLTNVAMAIQADAEGMALYDEIIVMGGAARVTGNVSPVAEFNFWTDPEAAQQVFSWAKVPISVIGLDVTRKALLRPVHREFLKQVNTQLAQLVCKVTRHYLNVHWELDGILGCTLNDPLAVAVAFMPEIVTFEAHTVDVATEGLCRGQMVVDYTGLWRRKKNLRLALDLDVHRFIEEFIVRMVSNKVSLQEIRKYLSEV